MSISMPVRTVRTVRRGSLSPGRARLAPSPGARVRRVPRQVRADRDRVPARSALPRVSVVEQPGRSWSITAMPSGLPVAAQS